MKNRIILLALLITLFSGCKVGPNYHRPHACIPEGWRTNLNGSEKYLNMKWWKLFNDPVLECLIDTALVHNKDLLIATARVSEFLGRYRSVRADLFPMLSGNATYGRQRISENLTPLTPGIKNPDNIYELFLSGTWEIDIWGKIRRATEAACADLLASEEARQTVIQTLVTSVAISYIDLLTLDEQLRIAKETTETRKKTLIIFALRYEAGVISKVELSQIESEYQDALATIPVFENAIAQQENNLSILLGHNPGPISRGSTINTIQLPQIPDETPSELLCRRPDIRQAVDELRAANARVGVAMAQYFPSISLTGEYGKGSRDLANLFTGGASMWNYFVPVAAPLFTAGRIAGDVKTAEAIKIQAVENYKRTLLNAFGEVDNSLVNFEKTGEQLEAQQKQVEALMEYARLARLRYDEGYTSYLEVLDAERTLFNVELDFVATLGNLYSGIINIYKAMGGGWICEADPMLYYD